MRARAAGEEGMALLVVMILMGVMLSAGLALVATVDTQSEESRAQRVRDSSFNLAESALNAQILALAREWPGQGDNATPYAPCTTAATSIRCPQSAALVAAGSPDLAGATWQTTVRDNGGGVGRENFYSETTTAGQPGYDANLDDQVWVRAQATVEGRRRTLVALVRAEPQTETIPKAALIAGSLDLSNNGNKDLISANGGLVAVRCTLAPGSVCLGHSFNAEGTGRYKDEADLMAALATQITGTTPVTTYQSGVPEPAMLPEARERLKATAIADGTYYTGCPPSLAGRVVYVENASGCPAYTGNGTINSAAAPGMLLVNAGRIALGGSLVFHGVIYAVNTGDLPGEVIATQGTSRIEGGVLIDGMNSVIKIGASGLNLNYDPNAFGAVKSYGSAGVVQNTFREIRG